MKKKNILTAAVQASRLGKWLCGPCGHCNIKIATCGHDPLKRTP